MKVLIIFLFLLYCISCGVKGDPLPPLTPPELGYGKPSFKKATKKIDFQQIKRNEITK